ARLRSQIGASDALLFATPEYNFSIPGVLKNAIDWASRPPDSPINLRPTAVLGAGGRLGTARAQQHFRNIALHNDLRVVQKPEVLINRLLDLEETKRRGIGDEADLAGIFAAGGHDSQPGDLIVYCPIKTASPKIMYLHYKYRAVLEVSSGPCS
ncbi:MAG: NAD(P)H-dependent oxidoreductase, partial [candidate division Zixibacteria bacterium]|nr:NAD(P)H-dependent oxidoreductase [candidate division Zixibacteria bacterium]